MEYIKEFVRYNLVSEVMDIKQPQIVNPDDMYALALKYWPRDLKVQECVLLFLLDCNRNVIAYNELSIGGISSSLIDVQIVLKYALNSIASGIILVHNHPSGNLNPSERDIAITTKIKQACEFIGIMFLDHLIITMNGYMSMNSEGQI